MIMQYWPVFAFTFALFCGSISVAIGATLWLSGQMKEQDAKRIEVKEAILKEVRERSHTLYGRLDQQYVIIDEKIDTKVGEVNAELKELGTRVTRLEAALENLIREKYGSKLGRIVDQF